VRAEIGEFLSWLDPGDAGFWRFDWNLPRVLVFLSLAGGLFFSRGVFRGWLWFMDGTNLLIHEAGHPILGIFGSDFLQFAGGTIFELAFPLIFFFAGLRQGQRVASDFCLFWEGTALLHVGWYIADARAMELPLVGGGEHDWNYMLGRLGILKHDILLGGIADFAGCAFIALAACGLYAHLTGKNNVELTMS